MYSIYSPLKFTLLHTESEDVIIKRRGGVDACLSCCQCHTHRSGLSSLQCFRSLWGVLSSHVLRLPSSPSSWWLSKSRIILFVFLLLQLSLSSFSPALLAVCSKYRSPPPESWREVCMGWNKKEREEGRKGREEKEIRLPEFQLSLPSPSFLSPNVSAAALHKACSLPLLLLWVSLQNANICPLLHQFIPPQ